MQEAFRLGGWGMFPTLFVGVVLVFAAIFVYAAPRLGLTPDAPRWPWSGTRGSEAVG